MAINLILHTFRMIFNNLGQALRVSVGPNLILIIATFFAFGSLGLGMYGGGTTFDENQIPGGFSILMMLLLIPLSLFVFAWVAVAWHRFILLEEYSGPLPAVSGRPIGPYIWKSILLGLMLLLLLVPIMVIFGGLAGVTMSEPAATTETFGTRLLSSLIAIPVSYVAMRWGVALVSTALGQTMGFFEAWNKTQPIAMVVLGVVVLVLAINLGLNLIVLLFSGLPLIPDLMGLVTSWLTMMLGISILTTLYGHVIEGRPLVD